MSRYSKQSLKIIGSGLTPTQLRKLGSVVRRTEGLEVAHVYNCNKHRETDVLALMSSIISNVNLTVLNIFDTDIGEELASALAVLVRRGATFGELGLISTRMHSSCIEKLSAALVANSTLHTLSLSCSDIDWAAARLLASGLKSNSSLHTLQLRKNRLEDRGVIEIGEALKSNESITSLFIGDNRIGEAGAKALADVLKSNATLQLLHLDINDIGDAGATAIAEALVGNDTLTDLDLSRNAIGPVGCSSVASMLKTNARLARLGLASNAVDEGIGAIGSALDVNWALNRLTITPDSVETQQRLLINVYNEQSRRTSLLARLFNWLACQRN